MLVRTRPFNPAVDRSFDRLVDQLVTGTATVRRTTGVDARWVDGDLVLTADLPGTPAEAVDVAVAGRVLTISVRTDDRSWSRSVRLGNALDTEQVAARYVDGRLTVTVGALATPEPRRIEVSTERAVIDTAEVESPQAESSGEASSDNG